MSTSSSLSKNTRPLSCPANIQHSSFVRKKKGLPLEIWHHVFQRLDLPIRGIRIAHWPGRVPEIAGFESKEDSLAVRALTYEDVLFPGSAVDFWLWLVPNATWKVQNNTDLWRLTRLERSVGACARHVAFELDYTGMRASMIARYVSQAPSDLKVLNVKELKQLRTFDVNVLLPLLWRGARFSIDILSWLRQSIGDILEEFRRYLPNDETGRLEICLFSASLEPQFEIEDDHLWIHGFRVITDSWFNCLIDPERLSREVIQLSQESFSPPASPPMQLSQESSSPPASPPMLLSQESSSPEASPPHFGPEIVTVYSEASQEWYSII